MLKNHSYKTNQKYNHSTKKENTMKIELNITSDHEVAEHTLKNIEDMLKILMLMIMSLKMINLNQKSNS